MVFLEQGEPLQFGVGLGEREHGRVARRDRLDLGIGEFLAADVLGPAGGVVAGHDLRDEPGLGFQCLPHISVERSFGDVAVDRDFLVFVALAEDAAVALLDFGRFPRCVEVMQGDQAFLDVGAGAHFLGAADQHADRAIPDLLEERLLLDVGFGVADGGDLLSWCFAGACSFLVIPRRQGGGGALLAYSLTSAATRNPCRGHGSWPAFEHFAEQVVVGRQRPKYRAHAHGRNVEDAVRLRAIRLRGE